MPRFTAKPIVIEAHRYEGRESVAAMPDDFRRAVRRVMPNGYAHVDTLQGEMAATFGDWVARGPDGGFSVIPGARFEATFEPATTAAALPAPPIRAITDDSTAPARRPPTRKDSTHA